MKKTLLGLGVAIIMSCALGSTPVKAANSDCASLMDTYMWDYDHLNMAADTMDWANSVLAQDYRDGVTGTQLEEDIRQANDYSIMYNGWCTQVGYDLEHLHEQQCM